jgi:long-chain acyl-CoA synthetase
MLEQTLGLFIPLIFGSKVVYIDSSRPSMIRSTFRSERITTVVAVPIILESFLESTARIPGFVLRSKGLREFIVGGAPLGDGIVRAWERKGIDVYVGYGLTETAPIVSCQRPGDAQRGTVGRPLPGVEVRIVDDEIHVRGDNVTVGYYKNESATKEAFDGSWFKTGDRGRLENGYVIVTGRKKNMIVLKNGMNVYPEDIERILDGYVDESVVVDKDDSLIGVALGSFDPQAVRRSVNAQLPVHMRLAQLIRWEGDLPRTRTMKIKRDEVRTLIARGENTPDDRLTAVLSRFASQVSEEASLGDLGIDSLDRMMLTARLEEEFSVQIDPSVVTAQCTVAELRTAIGRGAPRIGSFPKPFIVTRLLRAPFAPLLRLFGVRFELEKPPRCEGPVLLVSNHESHLDSVAIHLAFKGKLSIAAAADYFYRDHRSLGRFASWTLSTYPFEREGNPLSSFERSGMIMDAGHSILIYPEGTRGSELAPFKPGVGLLARELSCSVMPVHVSGGDRVLGKGSSRITNGVLSVRFGEPFTPKPSDDPEAITRRMYDAVKRAGERSSRR